MKRCIYCKQDLHDRSLIDFCERCGKKVFGDRMFNTILQNMQDADRRGDLDQNGH
jgi:rRNA maturation endonuclease Nob1